MIIEDSIEGVGQEKYEKDLTYVQTTDLMTSLGDFNFRTRRYFDEYAYDAQFGDMLFIVHDYDLSDTEDYTSFYDPYRPNLDIIDIKCLITIE